MQVEQMRMDGNAAAGALREIFAQEMTVAAATCASCGAEHAIGALLDYGHGMGIVLRCPGCGSAMLRMSRTPAWLYLDSSGISCLKLPIVS